MAWEECCQFPFLTYFAQFHEAGPIKELHWLAKIIQPLLGTKPSPLTFTHLQYNRNTALNYCYYYCCMWCVLCTDTLLSQVTWANKPFYYLINFRLVDNALGSLGIAKCADCLPIVNTGRGHRWAGERKKNHGYMLQVEETNKTNMRMKNWINIKITLKITNEQQRVDIQQKQQRCKYEWRKKKIFLMLSVYFWSINL